MRILLAGLLVAVSVLVLAPSDASAAADVYVKFINCAVHPGQLDIVYVENKGDTAQDLAGWELRSDGAGERMPLAPIGTLDPGEEIFASAGAHAVNLPNEGVFLWSNNEMLRDSGDPPDYAVLIDPAGNQVSGMDCNLNPIAAPTSAPTETPPPPAQETGSPTPPPASSSRPLPSNPGAGSRSSTNVSGSTQASAGTATDPVSAAPAPNSIPVGGGPPGVSDGGATGWLIAGALTALAGLAMTATAVGVRPRRPVRIEGSSRRCEN